MHLLKYETGMSTPTFNSTKKCFGFFLTGNILTRFHTDFFLFLEKKESAKMSNFDRKNNPLCIS